MTRFRPGDRVVAFHHIPCLECFYCRRKLYAQCPVYKRVGITAGFEPAGGGFAQYVRVMDWIVERGVEKIPDGVSVRARRFGRAVQYLSTKPWRSAIRNPDEFVAILGQGPIGLMFTMLVKRSGARIAATDAIAERLRLAGAVRRGIRLGSAHSGRGRGNQEADRRAVARIW